MGKEETKQVSYASNRIQGVTSNIKKNPEETKQQTYHIKSVQMCGVYI